MRTASQYLKRVETLRNDASVYAAARSMRVDAVGCLVIVDEKGAPVGIVTDRDLCMRAVATSHAPHEIDVVDVMTKEVVTVAPDRPMHEVVALMKSRGVRRLPVVDGGRVVGMVSLDEALEELSGDLRELAAEAPKRYREAPSSRRFEHVRHGIERHLEGLRSKLEYAQWYARETLVDELDELRHRLRREREDGE